ncbi:MAG: MBL fold metallo-hydrolase [Clostridium sp.]
MRKVDRMKIKLKRYIKNVASLIIAAVLVGSMTVYAAENPIISPTATPVGPQSPAAPREPGKTETTMRGPAQSNAENAYLGGATLTLLAPATTSQNLSCVIQTKNGSIIVVDGGLKEDTDHLIQTLQAKGGRVSAWLITHPHSDHIGALTEILNRNPIPIEIDHIYYSFLAREAYAAGENMGRMGDLDNLLAAFSHIAPEKLNTPLNKGQKIQVDDITINVMNLPFQTLSNTFNNSSIAYRVDVNGKRIMFLGDMGWEAGQNLMGSWDSDELRSDVVQMAHHGQDGVEEGLYRLIHPSICLWATPQWLWDNVSEGQPGPWKTLEVRKWMNELGVRQNYCIKDGDQILR